MIIKPHAAKRLAQRGIDASLIVTARRPTKKQYKMLKKECPVSSKKWKTGNCFVGRYPLITRSGICFIIEHPDILITAFRLGDENSRAK